MRYPILAMIFAVLALICAALTANNPPAVEWLPPAVDLKAQTATFYLPDLPPSMVIDHAVVVRDGEEIGSATGYLDMGLLTYDCEIWVRVYLMGKPPLDGPHLALKLGGGRQT